MSEALPRAADSAAAAEGSEGGRRLRQLARRRLRERMGAIEGTLDVLGGLVSDGLVAGEWTAVRSSQIASSYVKRSPCAESVTQGASLGEGGGGSMAESPLVASVTIPTEAVCDAPPAAQAAATSHDGGHDSRHRMLSEDPAGDSSCAPGAAIVVESSLIKPNLYRFSGLDTAQPSHAANGTAANASSTNASGTNTTTNATTNASTANASSTSHLGIATPITTAKVRQCGKTRTVANLSSPILIAVSLKPESLQALASSPLPVSWQCASPPPSPPPPPQPPPWPPERAPRPPPRRRPR